MKRILLATLLLFPSSAFADQTEAEACAASLSATGLKMYQATAPYMKPGTNIKDLLRTHIRPMVQSGSLTRSDARSNAPAVAECLKKL